MLKVIIFDLMHDNHVYVKNEDTCRDDTWTTPHPTTGILKLVVNRGKRCSCGTTAQTLCRPREAEFVCVCGGNDDNVWFFLFMECHAGVLQALQVKQPAAAKKKKSLSGQQHKSHGWYLVHSSCINGEGKELYVKH